MKVCAMNLKNFANRDKKHQSTFMRSAFISAIFLQSCSFATGLSAQALADHTAQAHTSPSSRMEAVHRRAAEHRLEMLNMPSVAPLFLEGTTIHTEITVVNAGENVATGQLMLKALDGSLIAKRPITVAGHSSNSLQLAALLTAAKSHETQGRVELYDDAPESSALAGQLTLSYMDEGHHETIDEELTMPGMSISHTIQGIAVNATSQPFVAVGNASLVPEDVIVNCFPENAAVEELHIHLQAQETRLLHGCLSLSATAQLHWEELPEALWSQPRAYAMSLSSPSPNAEIQAFGMVPNRKGGALNWTAMEFIDPDRIASSQTIFAGIPLGNTPALWGTYVGRLAVHNFAKHTQNVNLLLRSTLGDEVSEADIKSFQLAPGETRSVDLSPAVVSSAMLNTLVVQGDDEESGLATQLTLEDVTQDRHMQLIGKSGADDVNMGMHPWTLSGRDDDILLLYNQTDKPQKVYIRIGNGNSLWEKTLELPSAVTRSVSLTGLMSTALKDDHGNSFSAGVGYGEFSWTAEGEKRVKGRLLRLNSTKHTAESFQCAAYAVLCDALISGPDSLQLNQSGTWSASARSCINSEAPNVCTGAYGGYAYVNTYAWSAGGINLSPPPNQSYVSGSASNSGNGSLNVLMTGDSGCSASAHLDVSITGGQPAAVVNSLSPSLWTAGTTFPLQITGANFGSTPTVTISGATGVSSAGAYNTAADGKTTYVNVTVAANAPSGTAKVSVQPGYGGNGFACNNCNGGSGVGSNTATVQAVTPAPVILRVSNKSDLANCTNGTPTQSGANQTDVFAGEQVLLCIKPLAGFSILSQTWRFDENIAVTGGFTDTARSGKLPSEDAGGAEAVFPDLGGSSLLFYYHSPESSNTSSGQTVTLHWTLDNNDSRGAESSADFNILAPTQVNVSTLFSVAPVQFAIYSLNTVPSLQLGNAGNGPAADFGFAVQESTGSVPQTGSSPDFIWVQVIVKDELSRLESNGPVVCVPPTSLPALDSIYPGAIGDKFDDAPSFPLSSEDGEDQGQDNFALYLMWNPNLPAGCTRNLDRLNPGTCTSIPVPLGKIRWGWSGCAINVLQDQVQNPGSVLTSFRKKCGQGYVTSNFVPNAEFPQWSNFVQGSDIRNLVCRPR